MNNKRFTRTVENFICENCGNEVIGNGYTNHCNSCLWSKHVDINPGDREEGCGGLMKPIAGYKKNGKEMIDHCCTRCGFMRSNTLNSKDDFDTFLKIS